MELKIYSNQSNEIIFEELITNTLLAQYDINVNDEDFTELFETEILSDIIETLNYYFTFKITTSNTYYELK